MLGLPKFIIKRIKIIFIKHFVAEDRNRQYDKEKSIKEDEFIRNHEDII